MVPMAARLFFFVASLALGMCWVSQAGAVSPAPLRDMYLRSRERNRHGSEVRQVESAVRFLWNSRKIDVNSQNASDDFLLKQLACSLRRALPEARGAEFLQTIAGLIARETGRSDDASDILILLTHPRLCEPPRALQEIESEIKQLEGEILDLLKGVTE